MKYCIDRIEENYAVLQADDLTCQLFPKALLPAGAKEGSVVLLEEENITLCSDEEAKRRERLFRLQNKLKNKNGASDGDC